MRLPSKALREFVRSVGAEGWQAAITNGGHLRLTHPDAVHPVYASATPSDWRSIRNARGELNRALRGRRGT